MLDFAELRNRILMGEDEVPEEVKESALAQEFLRPADRKTPVRAILPLGV